MAHMISDPSLKMMPMSDQMNSSTTKVAHAFGKESRFGY